MPEISVHAIVLRRRDAGESDRRLTILTEELGKIDVTAKGARKAAARLAGISEPLSHAVLGIATGKKSAFVTQAQPMSAFRGLRSDFDRLTFGLALAELFAAVLPYDEPAPEAFELLGHSLEFIERNAKPVVAFIWAQVRLLELSGFLPQFDRCVVTDRLVSEVEPWLSPQAGGYVSDSEAGSFTDRFRARVEVLFGLSRIGEFEAPPENLKFATEAVAALLPFWRNIADMQLPANEAALRHLRQAAFD
ncbi:MAG TPA: DNA repair protein RecO [Fimbriimonas sp.]|nr:DNA repair protein RecO [Fimbriimonas sp.]